MQLGDAVNQTIIVRASAVIDHSVSWPDAHRRLQKYVTLSRVQRSKHQVYREADIPRFVLLASRAAATRGLRTCRVPDFSLPLPSNRQRYPVVGGNSTDSHETNIRPQTPSCAKFEKQSLADRK